MTKKEKKQKKEIEFCEHGRPLGEDCSGCDVLKKAQNKESKEISVVEGQPLIPKDFKSPLSRKQIDVIKEQFAKGASDVELQMFLYVCQRTGLDPFSKQIHLMPRWDSKIGKEVRQVVIGIDGLRSTAERTNSYAGNSDPIFEGESEIEYTDRDKKTKKMSAPARATVTVKKVVQGVICDFTATAEWSEYYPGDKGGMMWRKMPKNMLGKCAEAKALRKAFPAVMSGLYVQEEMSQPQELPPKGQNSPDSSFEKAKGMIAQISDAVGLGEAKDKISGSPKYNATQKKQLVKLIDERIKELTKNDAPETTEKDGTEETRTI